MRIIEQIIETNETQRKIAKFRLLSTAHWTFELSLLHFFLSVKLLVNNEAKTNLDKTLSLDNIAVPYGV